MKKESRVHTLYLRHSDISLNYNVATIDNKFGGWSNNKQVSYWNIDLRQALGSDWDKYDTFRIHLRQFSSSYANYAVNLTFDTIWITLFSGLNFKNSSYNPVTNNHTNRALLLTNWVGNTYNFSSATTMIPIHNYFSKGDALVKFQIEHFRPLDGTPVRCSTINGLPHCVFVYEIQGVE